MDTETKKAPPRNSRGPGDRRTALRLAAFVVLFAVAAAVVFYIGSRRSRPVDLNPSGDYSGHIVALDAGHGGVQPGCEFGGVMEKEITLAVTEKIEAGLKDLGVTVVLVRDGDVDVELADRCRIANEAGAELFVSIHCNSFTDDLSVSGFEGYFYSSSKGQRLATLILKAAEANSIKVRSVREENFQVLRETTMPAALMEIGFMSNDAEREKLQDPDYQQRVADSVVAGIIAMIDD